MEMRVEVRQAGDAPRPPAGTPVILEVRDVSLQDAPATILSSTRVAVAEPAGTPPGASPAGTPPDDAATRTPDVLATATIDVPEEALGGGRDVVVWVRVAASGQERTAVGDLITMQHCSVRRAAVDEPMEVPVTRIG